MPELFVTNFNPRFTGVSATTANVIRQQLTTYDLRLVGHPLPDCPAPITPAQARSLSRGKPDGHAFSIWHVRRNPEMRAAIWARDVLRLPIRIVFTSAAQRRHSAYPRWLISRMDALIATTREAADYVPNVHAVVPHGVDTDVFKPAENRDLDWQKLGYGGRRGIATIGRVRPEKGTDIFVEAMLKALPDLPDTVALVLGRASREHQGFLNDLKGRVSAAGMEKRILFPGEIAASDLIGLMRALSLVVQLPRYEGYGMVPLEGMASAVPFVGSATGYYNEFSTQGQCGVVVGLEATDEAAHAVGKIMSDPDRHTGMATSSRRIACENFSAAKEAAGIEAVYDGLWNRNKTTSPS